MIKVLEGNLGYVGYSPMNNSYFTDTALIDLYYFDESLACKHYQNGRLQDSFRFSYGNAVSAYVSEYKEGEIVISKPSVVCIFNAGKPGFSPINKAFMLGREGKVEKQSFYEYK